MSMPWTGNFFSLILCSVSSPEQKTAKRGRGRPRQYPEGSDGAPQVGVRLTPDLVSWVKESGGAAYIRALIVSDREVRLGKERTCAHCGQQIALHADQVEVQIRAQETSHFHIECALPLLGRKDGPRVPKS